MLRKLGFSRNQFEIPIENFSMGQKKKIFLAKSICEEAHLFIWDEPLNYIDVISRIQIENMILEYSPTMILVEHDRRFIEKVATDIIELSK
ncbi:ATP-binding cassette domain-containing protein [Sporanaerobacter acetigenes]|uniref:ATP-binding cassette domain-containing protein n=1 Tax=Sporanaerobacter acetigenes TaxID=165813 RepID=UPI00332419F2